MTNLWGLLDRVEKELPRRLHEATRGSFQSVFVDYSPPFVERLWFQLDAHHRVFLHHVLPCASSEALWHPHPWPSIVKVVRSEGIYEHGVGYDGTRSGEPPPRAVVQRIRGTITYEMTDPHAWHYVRAPESSWSIMIVGKPYSDSEVSPGYQRPTKKLSPLEPKRVGELIETWNDFYSDCEIGETP